MSTGRYHRFQLHNERAHRQSVLLQRSSNGRPVYVESADFTDWARIVRKQINRLARLHRRGVNGDGAWAIQVDPDNPNNNFLLQGGDNTDANAKEAWLGGFCALLHRTVSFDAQRGGEFNDLDAANLHHRATSVAAQQLIDLHSKFAVNALTGQTIHIEGAGEFEVLSNTATTIVVDTFDPANFPNLSARPWFWIVPTTVEGEDQVRPVYLDVHLEDWGMEEDSQLNHNIGGTPVECARREVLVRRVWLRQNADTPESPIEDYKDATGAQHYVLFLGNITRRDGIDAIAEDDIDLEDVEVFASSGDEVDLAREFAHFAVGEDHNADGVTNEQPRNLSERLARQDSWLVVGPTGDPGIYTGPNGLRDALAIGANGGAVNDSYPFTIFLRNGVYSITEDLVIDDRVRIVGESKQAIIAVNMTDLGDAVSLEGRAQLSNVTLLMTRGSVVVKGRSVGLSDLYVLQQSGNLVPAISFRTELDDHGAVGGSCLSDSTLVAVGAATPIISCTSNAAVPRFSNNFHEDATNDALGTSNSQDTYGTRIINCHIKRSVTGSVAAVEVNGGGTYLFQNCVFAAHNSPAYYQGGAYAVDNDDARCLVRMVGCDFVGVTGTQDNTDFSLVRHQGGQLHLDDCSFDFQDDESGGTALVRREPTRSLEVDLGSAAGSDKVGGASIRGCRVVTRGSGVEYPVYLRARGENQIHVDDLEVYQVAGGNIPALIAASAYSGSARVTLKDVRTNARSTMHHLHLSGNVSVVELFTDSSRKDLPVGSFTPSIANGLPDIRVAARDVEGTDLSDYSVQMVLRGVYCKNPPYCGLGVKESGVIPHRVVVDGLVVDGAQDGVAVAGYGVVLQHFNNVSISNANLQGLRFSGVVDMTAAAAIKAEVSGFAEEFYATDHYGLFDGDYSDLLSATERSERAGVYGGRSVECKVFPNPLLGDRTGAAGYIAPTASGSYSATVEARGSAVGAWLQNDGANKVNIQLRIQATDCEVGVFAIQTIASIRGVIEDCGRGIHLDSCTSPRVHSLDVVGDTQAVNALGCVNLKILNLSAHARSTAADHLVQLNACPGLVLRDMTIQGGNSSALVLLGCQGDIENSRVANTGALDRKFSSATRSHSIYMNSCHAMRLRQVTASFGILAVECHGDWDLLNCSAPDGGAIFFPDTSDAGTLRVIGGVYNADRQLEDAVASSSTRQPRTAAAIWAVPETFEVGVRGWQYVDVDGVMAHKALTQNAALSAAVAGDTPTDFTSRFATIHINAVYEARVNGCTLTGPNSNAIIGDLTYIEASSASDTEHRFGAHRVVATNNRFVGDYFATGYHAPLVVVGRDGRCHDIRGNVFHTGPLFNDYGDHTASIESIRFFTEEQASDTDWTRLIFVDNHAYRGDRFNEPAHLDFTIAFSANVLVDAHLAVDSTEEGVTEGWHEWPSWTDTERRRSVVARNSIRPESSGGDARYIRADGSLTADP